jgi:CRP-like cAMP-binding protein
MPTENRDPWAGLRGNLLLSSLPAREAMQIAPLLRRVHFGQDVRLLDQASSQEFVYFPETVVACLRFPCIDEGGVGVALVGREGMLGWSGLISTEHTRQDGVVQLHGGEALAADRVRLAALCTTNVQLLWAFLRYAHLLSMQLTGTLLSNLRDTPEARLCRWILMLHDRIEGDELAITHEALGQLLAVRRATITDALHVLEGERLVRCTRARIVVRDRRGLELRAGKAYGAPERAYSGLVAPFGRTREANVRSPTEAVASPTAFCVQHMSPSG